MPRLDNTDLTVIMNPVCVTCQTEMKVKDIGITIVGMFGNPPRPKFQWAAYTRECPVCGAVVACSYAQSPVNYYQDGFQEQLDTIPEESRVYSYEHRPATPK